MLRFRRTRFRKKFFATYLVLLVYFNLAFARALAMDPPFFRLPRVAMTRLAYFLFSPRFSLLPFLGCSTLATPCSRRIVPIATAFFVLSSLFPALFLELDTPGAASS